jgi:putative ABC transport system permease protein
MKIWESIRVAWKSIKGNKIRSVLTTLGVIIGVAAVIALIAVGQGVTQDITGELEDLGTNLIVVTGMRSLGGVLESADVEQLKRLPSISRVAPSISQNEVTVKAGTTSTTATVEGTNEDYPDVRNFKLVQGRFITPDDVDKRKRVAVIGQDIYDELYGTGNALGESITINGQRYTIIGLMESKGEVLGQDLDKNIFIPISSAERLLGTKILRTIYVQATTTNETTSAVAEINQLYEKKFGKPDLVRITSQDQLIGSMDSMTQSLTLMLGAIAGISLLVGGIGIMNIMLVSVTERTREIGIRKAIGARRRDIMMQFLVEAIILSIAGGIIGILLGALSASLISTGLGWATVIPVWSVLLAFTFSVLVGVFFGIYPAMKASKLHPIEALRRE